MTEIYKSILDELNQTEEIRLDIVLKILKSKRLLSDHIEILELSLKDIENESIETTNFFKFSHSTFLLAASAISFNFSGYFKYLLPTITIGYISLYSIKIFNRLKRKMIMKRIENFFNLLDKLEICIKRNLICFNEMNLLKINPDVSGTFTKEREKTFINTIKSISILLYKKLEEIEVLYPLSSKYEDIYEKLEDLENCEPFKNEYQTLSSADAKIFYNILAYTQSHFLMRFGLVASYYPITDIILYDLPKIKKIICKNLNEQKSVFEKFTKSSIKSINRREEQNQSSNSFSNLKNSSLIYSSKIMMIANECRNLDIDFQSIIDTININEFEKNDKDEKALLDILSRLKSIESNFEICKDEFNRFYVCLNKFINNKYNIPVNDSLPKIEQEEKHDREIINCVVNESTKNLIEDDFFAVDGNMNENIDENLTSDDDLLNVNNRLVKSYFKPVLNQLKEKIEPINDIMKSKEKMVLASKGINIDEIDMKDENIKFNKEKYGAEKYGETDSGEDTDDDDNFSKPRSSQSKYAESRDFLITKQQTNFIPPFLLGLPKQSMVEEDVIGD